jgi:hypothetical protein
MVKTAKKKADKKPNRFTRTVIIVLLLIAAGTALTWFYMDRIVTFYVNHYTDYRISYTKWIGNPLGRSEVQGLYFEIKSKGMGIHAEKGILDIHPKESYRRKVLLMDCKFTGVAISTTTPQKSDKNPANDLMSIPFSADNKYESIVFAAAIDAKSLVIDGFKGTSDDVRMEGKFSLIYARDEVDVDIKISFSPALVANLPGELKDRALSVDDDGWYCSVITYKGNIMFLKALYAIAS